MVIDVDGTDYTTAAWRELEKQAFALQLPDLKISTYEEFFLPALRVHMAPGERRAIVSNARGLLKNFYVHEPFKHAQRALENRPAFDPFAELDKIDQLAPGLPDDAFHRQVRNVFVQHADAHTVYGLPDPYANAVVFLPCQFKHYFDEFGRPRFLVSKMMDGFRIDGQEHPFFKVGVEVIAYNEMPIVEAVNQVGLNDVGGNASAFLATALSRMSIRPLAYALRPDDPVQVVGYRPLDGGDDRQIELPWGVGTAMVSSSLVFDTKAVSMAEERTMTAFASKMVYSTSNYLSEKADAANAPFNPVGKDFRGLFDFQTPDGAVRDGLLHPGALSLDDTSKRFGYLRIKSFGKEDRDKTVSQEGEIASEFGRLLGIMMDRAHDGLVLDIRGNGGGNVKAAEAMLQMLTPNRIHPANFHWRRTGAIETVLRKGSHLKDKFFSPKFSEDDRAVNDGLVDFVDWLGDLKLPPESLPQFLSSAKPLTSPRDANDTGQIYQGPVILLIDGFTYSAADIFTAGFDDNNVGLIVGTTPTTGGGGATVWQFDEFRLVVAQVAGVPLEPLPPGVRMSIAVQRVTRVLGNLGKAIEDVGVRAHRVINPTRNDVLNRGVDLVRSICGLLCDKPAYRLKISDATLVSKVVTFSLTQAGPIARLAALVDDKAALLTDLGDGRFSLPLPGRIEVQGFSAQGELVVATRAEVKGPAPS